GLLSGGRCGCGAAGRGGDARPRVFRAVVGVGDGPAAGVRGAGRGLDAAPVRAVSTSWSRVALRAGDGGVLAWRAVLSGRAGGAGIALRPRRALGAGRARLPIGTSRTGLTGRALLTDRTRLASCTVEARGPVTAGGTSRARIAGLSGVSVL